MPTLTAETTAAERSVRDVAAAGGSNSLAYIAELWRECGLRRPCRDEHEWAFVPPGRFVKFLQYPNKAARAPYGLRICARCCAAEAATEAELEAFRRGEWPDILYVDGDVEQYGNRAGGRRRSQPRRFDMNTAYEETLAYDLHAFKGVGGPVIISEGLAPGSGEFTVFVLKPNGTGLRHVVGSPQGSIESCRAFVAKKVAERRWVPWSPKQQRAAGYEGRRRP